MILKDILSKETYEDLVDFLHTGEDAITLIAKGYDAKRSVGTDNVALQTNMPAYGKATVNRASAEAVVTRFQTLADPKYVGAVKESFGAQDGVPSIVMLNVPRLTNGYSSFALREPSNRIGALRYPLVGSFASSKKYFGPSELVCPNFKDIITKIEKSFKVKIRDNSSVRSGGKFTHNRHLRPWLKYKAARFVNIFARKNPKIFLDFGSLFGKKQIRLRDKINGTQKIAEADKLVYVLNMIAKKANTAVFKSLGKRSGINSVTNKKKVMAATEIMTTMFLAQCFDMGKNEKMAGTFNQKVDHALRLQLSNIIASMGNVENANNFEVMTDVAEKSVAVVLKKLGMDYRQIAKVRANCLGVEYKEYPRDLHSALYSSIVYTNRYFVDKEGELNAHVDYPVVEEELEELSVAADVTLLPEEEVKLLEAPKSLIPDPNKPILLGGKMASEEEMKLYETKRVISALGAIRDKKKLEELNKKSVVVIEKKPQTKVSREKVEKAYYDMLNRIVENKKKAVKDNDTLYLTLEVLSSYTKDGKNKKERYRGKGVILSSAEALYEDFETRKENVLNKIFEDKEEISVENLKNIAGTNFKSLSATIKKAIDNALVEENSKTETQNIKAKINKKAKELAK